MCTVKLGMTHQIVLWHYSLVSLWKKRESKRALALAITGNNAFGVCMFHNAYLFCVSVYVQCYCMCAFPVAPFPFMVFNTVVLYCIECEWKQLAACTLSIHAQYLLKFSSAFVCCVCQWVLYSFSRFCPPCVTRCRSLSISLSLSVSLYPTYTETFQSFCSIL